MLIATAIFSFSAAALIAVYSTNLANNARIHSQSTARLHLQSLMSESEMAPLLREGDTNGEFGDGYSWKLGVEPYSTSFGQSIKTERAWRVTATVEWRDAHGGRSIESSTLRIGGESK